MVIAPFMTDAEYVQTINFAVEWFSDSVVQPVNTYHMIRICKCQRSYCGICTRL